MSLRVWGMSTNPTTLHLRSRSLFRSVGTYEARQEAHIGGLYRRRIITTCNTTCNVYNARLHDRDFATPFTSNFYAPVWFAIPLGRPNMMLLSECIAVRIYSLLWTSEINLHTMSLGSNQQNMNPRIGVYQSLGGMIRG
ncbi:hypothetical protein ABW19_dt0200532 [Dactylella cylindrospora]|nr:hypothetical protein ABW19_dt0200532 [Dactylella cylindrospora]